MTTHVGIPEGFPSHVDARSSVLSGSRMQEFYVKPSVAFGTPSLSDPPLPYSDPSATPVPPVPHSHTPAPKDASFKFQGIRALRMAKAARATIDAELNYLRARIVEEQLILGMLEDEVESIISRRDDASKQFEDIRKALLEHGVEIPPEEELPTYPKRAEKRKFNESESEWISDSPVISPGVIHRRKLGKAREEPVEDLMSSDS